MDTSELALVFFSILAQLAVGSFLVLGLVAWLAERKAGKEQAEMLAGWGWWAILGVMVVALIASLTHLGNPKNAYLSVLNWQSAWLSREILCALAFTGFLALFVFLKWRKIGAGTLQAVTGIMTAVFGILLVFVMSMIYSYIRTQPAWNTPYTGISFYATALLLGALGAGVILSANYLGAKKMDPECKDTQCSLLRSALQGISLGAIALAGIELVALPVYLLNLVRDPAGALTGEAIITGMGGMLVTRLVLAVLGAGVLAAIINRVVARQGQEKLAANLVYAAFALVLVAEFLGRFIFYVSNVRIGI
jgi:anaerobic dimethyl sulfoxide reductase subunit C (anchor subunit)